MPARKFTILVIPEGSHRVRRYSLGRNLLRCLAAAALAAVFAVTLLALDYYRLGFDREELQRLKAENSSQRDSLRTLSARFQGLRKEMVVLAQSDAKVRVMAKLDAPKSDSLTGIGGPPGEGAADDLSELQLQIDRLEEAIDLRRASQEEIQGFLNDQRSLLAAKPQGWPVKGWMSSGFGMRKSPFTGRPRMHEGLDVAARLGTPIVATADGVVSRAGAASGYGKLVVIDHGYGYRTYYGHNSKIHVKVGQKVKRGEKIAAVGNTGRSTGPHVHYEVRRNGVPTNPRKFL